MPTPAYMQIADDLRQQIKYKALAPGDSLPAEADLCQQYGESRNAVRDAIKRLICEGLLESRSELGTFVARKIDPFVTVLTGDPDSGFGNSYLRGELSGSLSLLNRITSDTLAIEHIDPYEPFRHLKANVQVVARCDSPKELPHQAFSIPGRLAEFLSRFRSHALQLNDDVFLNLSGRQRDTALMRLLYSEDRARLQAAAVVRLLAVIMVVATVILSAVRSIFRFLAAAVTIVRTSMAHRNSREPAYDLTHYRLLYKTLAGIALA
jgi:hypothetical protein